MICPYIFLKKRKIHQFVGGCFCLVFSGKTLIIIESLDKNMKDYTLRIFLALILLLILIVTIFFRNQFNMPEYVHALGFIICTVGVIFIIAAILTLGKYFTTSINPKGLVTTGIYSKIRHPMFTGAILVYIGIVVIFQSIIGFLLVLFILLPFFIYSAIEEEKILSEKFKDKYLAYKKKTLF